MWEIIPRESVGRLKLNATIYDAKVVLGCDCEIFRRTNNPNPIAAFTDAGVHLEVGADGRGVGITIFAPAKVALSGVSLLGNDVIKVRMELKKAGLEFSEVDAGLWSDLLLIMIVEHEGRVDGVEVRRIPYR